MSQEPPWIQRRGRAARAVPVLGLGTRTAGTAVVAALRRRRGKDSTFHEDTAERYAEFFGRSKGALMKAGQYLAAASMASVTTDGTHQVYQRAFARLQDSAPPMPFAVAAAMIEAELGAPPEDLFAEIDREPLAAASIGQVHAARCHDGRRVAVKVQYPGVEQAIRSDLANTELLATFFDLLQGLTKFMRVDTRALAGEMSARILEELDYRTEAANQSEFAEIYRGHPFVRVPEVVPELSAQRVTMDLVEGRRFADAVGAPTALRDSWGEAIVRFLFSGSRRRGLMHGDGHPGNFCSTTTARLRFSTTGTSSA